MLVDAGPLYAVADRLDRNHARCRPSLAERLDVTRLATLDHRHFAVVSPRHAQAFELLPA